MTATDPSVRDNERAVHEAAHAVQAFVNGLDVHCITLRPPLVRTLRQHFLTETGRDLVDPADLDDQLVEFFRLDVEVRIAGPLAALRHNMDSTGGDLDAIDPRRVNFALWGGGSREDSPGDFEVAMHEVNLLTRVTHFHVEAYLDWVKGRIWSETILHETRWTAIRNLADELVLREEMGNPEVHELLGTRHGLTLGVLGSATTHSHSG